MTVLIAAVGPHVLVCPADSDSGQDPEVRKKSAQWGCVWKTEPIDFHADGWIDQMLLPFLPNSLSIREGQGQSNSHQLFWFFRENSGASGSRVLY